MATTALAERRAYLGHAVTVTQLSDSRSLMYFDDVDNAFDDSSISTPVRL